MRLEQRVCADMRLLLVVLLLAVSASAWKQCGPPSERVVKVGDVSVQTEPRENGHWVSVQVEGTVSRRISAGAILRSSVVLGKDGRPGGIGFPLEERQLGQAMGPGPFSYTYQESFDAPEHLDVFVKLAVVEGESEVLCLRDLEIKL
jgi:hypothetical protein